MTSLATEDGVRDIVRAIGLHRKVLRVKRRDDLGLIDEATLYDPRERTEVDVQRNDAAVAIAETVLFVKGERQYSIPRLRRLTRGRNQSILGFLEIGCPDDGSEWYVLAQ